MSIVDEVLKKLNHNGASRRYSKSDAQLFVKLFEPLIQQLVEKRFNKKLKKINNEKHYYI
jgi:hypothetical protein